MGVEDSPEESGRSNAQYPNQDLLEGTSCSSIDKVSSRAQSQGRSHGSFGEVMNLNACSLLCNPALVRWHPQGRHAKGSQRSRAALPDGASTEFASSTFSGGSSRPGADGSLRRAKRSGSAPCLSSRYCEPSKHLSGQEILARKQSRSATSTSLTRSSIRSQGGSGSRVSGSTFADWFEGADGLSVREEAASSSRINHQRVPRMEPRSPAAEEDLRESIREELINIVGGSMEAFRMMDLNGSGRISLQEFGDGMERIGVPWQELTGFRWMLHLFTLFDQNRDGVVDLEEFFPSDTRKDDGPRRLNTPDFLEHWCDWSDRYSGRPARDPKWEGEAPRVELKRLFKAKKNQAAVAVHRKWMSSMFRRLKNRGKSDAQVRECIAAHLPRGTGPKDRQNVQTFSDAEVKNCKRQYNDGMQNHVRMIQKEVYTMREQRQNLADTRQQLFTITGPLLAAQRHEEEKKNPTKIDFGGFLHGPAHKEGHEGEGADESGSGSGDCETGAASLGAAFRRASQQIES